MLEPLPADLPRPEDDGAAFHLAGIELPNIRLDATGGRSVRLSDIGAPWAVIYVYPMTGRPDRDLPDGWEMIPGARGCTPQTCAFRDLTSDFAELGCEVYGLSVQPTAYQQEMVDRLHVGFPVLSDPDRRLGAAIGLPIMEVEGMSLYKRLTMAVRDGVVSRVWYPVFPPDRNAGDVLNWLRERTSEGAAP